MRATDRLKTTSHSVTGRLLLACAAGAFCGLFSGAAFASEPLGTYCVPSGVELLPDGKAPTEVVIHGAFVQLISDGHYDEPRCGRMYLACQPGQEEMCRFQWNDVIAIGKDDCAGFGGKNVLPLAKVRTESEPLGKPDVWDLGMGVGQGMWIEGKCPVMRKLSCPLTGGMGGSGGIAGGTGGVSATGGATETGGAATGGAPSTGGGPATAGAPATGGADSTTLVSSKDKGCQLASDGAASGGVSSVLALLGLGLWRRRRFRGSRST